MLSAQSHCTNRNKLSCCTLQEQGRNNLVSHNWVQHVPEKISSTSMGAVLSTASLLLITPAGAAAGDCAAANEAAAIMHNTARSCACLLISVQDLEWPSGGPTCSSRHSRGQPRSWLKHPIKKVFRIPGASHRRRGCWVLLLLLPVFIQVCEQPGRQCLYETISQHIEECLSIHEPSRSCAMARELRVAV